MNLSISNIAWDTENNAQIYDMMNKIGFTGLEIAPTKIFPSEPYNRCAEARVWAKKLFADYGFKISSMQSIWYGRKENLFGTREERKLLLEYTKKAVEFAEATECKNLVFGCPKNRNMPADADSSIAVEFFGEIGEYAAKCGTVIGMEANPPIYNTNYINDTSAAIELIEKVNSKGFLLNLDIGTMVENGESVSVLKGKEHLINHVHISEPGLKAIKKRKLHEDIAKLLSTSAYKKFVSIEVGKQDDVNDIMVMMEYIQSIMQ